MKNSIICFITILLLLRPLRAGADDSSGDSLRTFLQENVGHAGMIVGLVDEQGSRVICAGKLDNGTDQEVNGDTLFDICSVTKTFTVLLLQDMVERGEMKLDDPVAKYLPDSVTMPSHNGKQITLLDLATQTSGLPREPDNLTSVGGLPANPYADYTSERMYAFLSHHTLNRDPGAEFGYSNVGMALLGQAITLKAGEDFETLAVKRICRPLGMDSTRITLTPELKDRLATGHDERGDRAPIWEFQVYNAAGGLRSTANDLLKYVSANLGLVPSDLTPLMEKTHVVRYRGAPIYGNTAMPWMDRGITDQIGGELLGHAGGNGGYESFIGFDKKNRRGVVVLCSQQGGLITEKLGWFLLEGVELTPEIAAGLSAGRGAQLVGVGLKLKFDRESRTIQAEEIIPNSPAAEAGLKPGFVLKRINGIPTSDKSLEHCASLIRGPAGSEVRLELVDSDGHVNAIDLTRQKLRLPN